MTPEARYLWGQINQHVKRFFLPEAVDLLQNTRILFLPFAEALQVRGKAIVIPTDIPVPQKPLDPWQVPFNGTRVTLWNRIRHRCLEEWEVVPHGQAPLWYKHPGGALMPAWNLVPTLFGLLTFREEVEGEAACRRDGHGRFVASASPRSQARLLEVPAFNETAALLVAACKGLQAGTLPAFEIPGLVKPPVLVLSHDVDALLGSNFWTQSARLFRAAAPLKSLKPPRFSHLKWFYRNALNPKKYYFDNIAALVETEKKHGYHSSFYFLNGRLGRYGARSSTRSLAAALKEVPVDWQIGIHYNYDTFLREKNFEGQVAEFAAALGSKPSIGRAHYLRFDPEKSLPFLVERGIYCDETAGYPDRIGFRCAIAGPFRPFDSGRARELPIWEMPLAVMDTALLSQYPRDPAGSFSRILTHLNQVGGALSLLLHPDRYNNPEFPGAMGLYEELLAAAVRLNARGTHCRSLLSE